MRPPVRVESSAAVTRHSSGAKPRVFDPNHAVYGQGVAVKADVNCTLRNVDDSKNVFLTWIKFKIIARELSSLRVVVRIMQPEIAGAFFDRPVFKQLRELESHEAHCQLGRCGWRDVRSHSLRSLRIRTDISPAASPTTRRYTKHAFPARCLQKITTTFSPIKRDAMTGVLDAANMPPEPTSGLSK
jgi:hypothetical protein